MIATAMHATPLSPDFHRQTSIFLPPNSTLPPKPSIICTCVPVHIWSESATTQADEMMVDQVVPRLYSYVVGHYTQTLLWSTQQYLPDTLERVNQLSIRRYYAYR